MGFCLRTTVAEAACHINFVFAGGSTATNAVSRWPQKKLENESRKGPHKKVNNQDLKQWKSLYFLSFSFGIAVKHYIRRLASNTE